MKVLLSAYACEPDKGGEPGIGWHWVVETARLGHTVWVITRANNRGAIERASLSMPNLHFVYHDLPQWVAKLKKRGPLLEWYYAAWQRSAYRRARVLHREQRFDIVQHVTFGVFRQASYMGRLGIPFVFGPVGGGERTPIRLRMNYGLRGHLLDTLRDAANLAARWSPWLHDTLATARLILVKTPHTAKALPERYRYKVRHIIEIGAPQAVDAPPPRAEARGIRYLFVGRFLFWKGMQDRPEGIRATPPSRPRRSTDHGRGGARRPAVATALSYTRDCRCCGMARLDPPCRDRRRLPRS